MKKRESCTIHNIDSLWTKIIKNILLKITQKRYFVWDKLCLKEKWQERKQKWKRSQIFKAKKIT